MAKSNLTGQISAKYIKEQFFTSEELPCGVVMFTAKAKDGRELGCIVRSKEQAEEVFSGLLLAISMYEEELDG